MDTVFADKTLLFLGHSQIITLIKNHEINH